MEKSRSKNTEAFSLLFAKYSTVLNVLSILLLAVLGFQFLIRPVYRDVQEQKQSGVREAEALLEQRQKTFDDLKSSAELYQTIDMDELRRLFEIVPSASSEHELYREMNGLIEQAGYEMKSISVTDGGEESIPNEQISLKTHNINVTVSGVSGYEAFKSLLNRLENHLRVLDLSSISFQPAASDYVFNLKTYSLN